MCVSKYLYFRGDKGIEPITSNYIRALAETASENKLRVVNSGPWSGGCVKCNDARFLYVEVGHTLELPTGSGPTSTYCVL